MTVVGTVGHIDHGKTALLRTLTGIDADRLPEEQRRGMTIDVGYAHLDLGHGRHMDFVDLPGHHDLTGNFLVGVGEIDAALLVIAANEGPQAQTLEHLDILAGYGVADGLAVVTKLDLVDRHERRNALRVAAELVEASVLSGRPLIGVSARTGEGMEDLRDALRLLDCHIRDRSKGVRSGRGSARLAVDRTFRSPGRGLVVTGTLRAARLRRGDAVRIEPGGKSARIRGIQVHGQARESVDAGGRVALNLASIDETDVRRGSVIVSGPAVTGSRRILVTAQLLSRRMQVAERQVVLHIGTDHVTGGLQWLQLPASGDRANGEFGLALLTLRHAVAAAPGDRLVIRIPSPAHLYAGGSVLDSSPPAIGMRVVRVRLPMRIPDAGDANAVLTSLLAYRRAMSISEFVSAAAAFGLDDEVINDRLDAVSVGAIVINRDALAELTSAAVDLSRSAGGTDELDAGAPLEAVRAQVARTLRRVGGLSTQEVRRSAVAVVGMLVNDGRLFQIGDLLLDATRQERLAGLLGEADAHFLSCLATPHPPGLSSAAESAGLPMAAISRLVTSGRVVRLAPDLGYAAETYAYLIDLAIAMARRGDLSAAAFRDAAGTSRKNAVILLDAMSTAGVIRREGTGHVLGPRAPLPHDRTERRPT